MGVVGEAPPHTHTHKTKSSGSAPKAPRHKVARGKRGRTRQGVQQLVSGDGHQRRPGALHEGAGADVDGAGDRPQRRVVVHAGQRPGGGGAAAADGVLLALAGGCGWWRALRWAAVRGGVLGGGGSGGGDGRRRKEQRRRKSGSGAPAQSCRGKNRRTLRSRGRCGTAGCGPGRSRSGGRPGRRRRSARAAPTRGASPAPRRVLGRRCGTCVSVRRRGAAAAARARTRQAVGGG